MAIGKRIKEARLKKSLTQEELAKIVGVTKGAIANYESNTSNPKEPIMYALIEALDVDANFLFQDCVKIKKAPTYSVEAMTLARDYDSLDKWGQKQVRSTADIEIERMADEQQARTAENTSIAAELAASRNDMEAAEEIEYFTIPIYNMPMSAGTGQEAGQEYPEDFLLKKRPPRGTSYIAHICGDSMEPTYHDGDLVFIYSTLDIDVGQVGAFFMDGQMWVKELGDGVLISHNPDYPPRPMTEDIRCQGLVLGVCDDSYFE